ncbi:component of gems 5 [Cavenderia fasciculata]|uniref:Component of gems 5 n=1 Tax=Cavenderia fasciculata TaxID=261658 RepID=F4PQA2_CACFS|nr:component of gems 5 [Cavenderia fasciculata]EGG22565.1 component of gems 5 [Cavenderia fasciculata]|eukprot:XP_004360416.1 component of gems 5 [Cavenderia fasciculata]
MDNEKQVEDKRGVEVEEEEEVKQETNENDATNSDTKVEVEKEEVEEVEEEEEEVKIQHNNQKSPQINILPSSANWYNSQIADCNSNAIYVVASKFTLFLFDVEKKKYIGELLGHTERILSVCFNKTLSNLCVSSSSDKSVRLWDINTLQNIKSHNIHQNEVTFVTFSNFINDIVVSGDKDGKIIVWRTFSNDIKVYQPIPTNSSQITCLAFSNHQDLPNLITIGYMNGMVILFDIVTGLIVSKIAAHTDEIQCLLWIDIPPPKPSKLKDLDTESTLSSSPLDRKSITFVSSSKDRSIKVWRQVGEKLDSGFHPIHQLVPGRSGGGGGNSGGGGEKQRTWLTVSWSPKEPQYLVSNSLSSDLYLWNLTLEKPIPEKFGGIQHQRTIFNITQIPYTSTSTTVNNTKYPCSLMTTSMDRNLIYWESMKGKWKISSIGGFVYSITSSPFSPNTISMGCGDNSIRQWSPTAESTDYDAKWYWKGIQSKITAISICPTNGCLIAFGLDDGRVGVYDIDKNNSFFFPGAHRKEVYDVQWRTIGTEKLLIYSVGNNDVFEWDYSGAREKGFKNTNDYIKIAADTSNSPPIKFGSKGEFCWNDDQTMIVMSNLNGEIRLFDSQFNHLAVTKDHKSLVNRIRWNPHPDYKNYFASASLDKTIIIYRTVVSSNDDNDGTTTVKLEIVKHLKGHKGGVFGLCWSPHVHNILASCSADASVQVWNTDSGEPIGNLRGHDGRVFAVQFSFMYPNVIFSGGEDQTVRMWDYTMAIYKNPPTEISTVKKTMKSHSTKESSSTRNHHTIMIEQVKVKDEKIIIDSIPQQQQSQQVVIVSTDPIQNNNYNNLEKSPSSSSSSSSLTTTTTSSILVPIKKKSKVILPIQYKLQSQNLEPNIIGLAKTLIGQKDINNNNNNYNNNGQQQQQLESVSESSSNNVNSEIFEDGVFSNIKGLNQTMKKEMSEHLQNRELENYFSLCTWDVGGIQKALAKIAKNGQLSPHYVALAAQGGRELWKSTCELYIAQLILEGDYHMAVSYQLAIGKVIDAIELYRKAGYLQEAILLARKRLSPTDTPQMNELIESLYFEWGQLSEVSNYLNSIKCYLAANRPQLAINLLKSKQSTSRNQSLLTELQNLYQLE